MGDFLRDVMKLNADARNFRVFGPDETASNRLGALFEVTDRAWMAETLAGRRPSRARRPGDGDPQRAHLPGLARRLSADRPARLLLLLRGVHPHRRLDVQPARQVAEGRAARFPGGGRSPRSTILLTSHVWRQDHNGFSHQDPGFIDHVVNKKADVIRVYLPPDANTLLSVTDHCLRSRNLRQRDRRRQAAASCSGSTWTRRSSTAAAGIGIWEWASNDQGGEPDVVMACAGDVPTLETLAAVDLLRQHAARPQDPRRQRGRPDDAAAAGGASARPVRPATSTRCSPPTSRSSSPTTAIRG